MELVYRTYDGKEFDQFKDSIKHEMSSLGIIMFDSDCKVIKDYSYEECLYMYVPKGGYASIIGAYKYLPDVDECMWKFVTVDAVDMDKPLLFYWVDGSDVYDYHHYTDALAMVTAIEEEKKKVK